MIEALGKLFVLLVSSAYVAGFIVVNVHLSSLGFQSPGFLETQYLLAGLWTFFPAIVGGLLASGVSLLIESLGNKASHLVFGLLVLVTMVTVLPAWALAKIGVHPGPTWLAAAAAWAVIAGLVYDHTRQILVELRQLVPASGQLKRQINGLFLLLLVLPAYFGLFARFMYSDIPVSLGGGKPATVKLVWKGSAPSGLGLLAPDPAVDLFLATNAYLLVVLPDGRPVVLARDAIGGIVFAHKYGHDGTDQ